MVKAAPAVAPVPNPGRIPCNEEGKPEGTPDFNSLRPYQASPCGDSEKALYCANAIIIYEGFSQDKQCHGLCATDKWQKPKEYAVTISGVSLPFYGNTEQTANSTTPTDTFGDAQKLSEYVSWYLSGVNGRAEYGNVTNDQIINFSGPLKKLLPSAIQDAQRIATIDTTAKTGDTVLELPDSQNPKVTPDVPLNHNQIVVCANKAWQVPAAITNFLGITPFGLGTANPVPCYGGPPAGVYKLKSWDQNLLELARGTVDGYISKFLEGSGNLGAQLMSNVLFERWSKKIPPLPWQFTDSQKYTKAYNEWRGDWCALITIPFTKSKQLICVGIPGITNNEFADLYQYIPLTNNSDKNAKMPIEGVQIEATEGTISFEGEVNPADKDSTRYKILKEPVGMFAHTEEDSENLDLLAKTYMPENCKDGICNPIERKVDYSTVETGKTNLDKCRIVDVRSNPGDSLFLDLPPSEVRIWVAGYHVTQMMCDEYIKCDDSKKRIDLHCSPHGWFGCHATVQISIRNSSKHPYATEVWNSAVADSASVFRKIYPKVEEGAPVSCIADIPGVSNAVYTPTEGTKEITVVNPEGRRTDPNASQLYFPHIGGVYEYFLKGIQTALLPKGYGAPSPSSGQYCTNIKCADLPNLPKAAGACNLGDNSLSVPNSFKSIISAAAETYKVPPNLILGIMFGEGAFNPGRYNWTEQNVKNWASCVPLPNCSPGGGTINSVVPFIGTYWDNLAQKILPDLKKIDPTKTKADPCNLLDATFGLAKDLHDNAGGSSSLTGKTCFGITMSSTNPSNCAWSPSQYETAIRVWEFGTAYDSTYQCATKENSCATGGGADANCPTGGDTCETQSNRYANKSHNGCVWDIAAEGSSGNKR